MVCGHRRERVPPPSVPPPQHRAAPRSRSRRELRTHHVDRRRGTHRRGDSGGCAGRTHHAPGAPRASVHALRALGRMAADRALGRHGVSHAEERRACAGARSRHRLRDVTGPSTANLSNYVYLAKVPAAQATDVTAYQYWDQEHAQEHAAGYVRGCKKNRVRCYLACARDRAARGARGPYRSSLPWEGTWRGDDCSLWWRRLRPSERPSRSAIRRRPVFRSTMRVLTLPPLPSSGKHRCVLRGEPREVHPLAAEAGEHRAKTSWRRSWPTSRT